MALTHYQRALLHNLQVAIKRATTAGLLDTLAGYIPIETIHAFRNAVEKLEKTDKEDQ